MKTLRDSRGRQVSSWMAVLVIVMLVAGAVALQYSMDDSSGSRPGWDDSGPFDSARSVLDMLGGIRQSVAANFWSKTDDVYHRYFGSDIAQDQAIFPYYWTITRLDPHFVMAYYFASWLLARLGNVDDGLAMALEGLRYNPGSAQLQENLAHIYFFFKKDPARARYHMLKAIKLTDDEEQRQIYERFLRTIDEVIAGEKEIPEPATLDAGKHDLGHHHDDNGHDHDDDHEHHHDH